MATTSTCKKKRPANFAVRGRLGSGALSTVVSEFYGFNFLHTIDEFPVVNCELEFFAFFCIH